MTDAAALAQRIRTAFAPGRPPARLGVAVSGGGDSMALLHLLADWTREGGPSLAVVTVDHGLRPEAAAEAAMVGEVCAVLGLPHDTLRWHWDGTGNLPDQARRARLRLIAGWAATRGIGTVALGHTEDDQAETFLMRLARGSGVDGLSGMAPRRSAEGIDWVRPLLAASRADLRAFLRQRGVGWIEDPTNDDDAYQRVRARRALEALRPLGLGAEGLAQTAARMAEAQAELGRLAAASASEIARLEAGDLVFRRDGFAALGPETQRRLLAEALRWVASAEYRPRHDALMNALSDIREGTRHTLAGCLLSARANEIRVTREYQAVRGSRVMPDALWDSRWRVSGPEIKGLKIGALGETGLRACPDWRATGLLRRTLLVTPAVWRGAKLVAAPLAGRPEGWTAIMTQDQNHFVSSLLSH